MTTRHPVYLTPSGSRFAADHPFNRPVEGGKGLIADDEIPADGDEPGRTA